MLHADLDALQTTAQLFYSAGSAGSAEESERKNSPYVRALIAECERLTGRGVADVSFPAGEHRAAFRAILADGSSVIVTRRDNRARAVLEERVLNHLSRAGAPVPRVLGFNGLVLIQSDEGETRLAERLVRSEEDSILLPSAAESLLQIQQSARKLSLADVVPLLGTDGDWVRALIDRPAVLGAYLKEQAPVPELDAIFDILMLAEPTFVKWDARPANAVLSGNEQISWIDWEHCGARNGLDDLIWLLCDENVSEDSARDRELLKEYSAAFAPNLSANAAAAYARVAGTFHLCVRLCLLLTRAEEDGWGSAVECASRDKVGTSPMQAMRLCTRAADWAAHTRETAALSPWFERISKKVAA